ncbi:hypothetical protein ON010_g17410 [Phytophthora cinnamomi]|nr:hypothetical protein ON010_g17410 [Phytophthora cinnamomi]
MATASIIRKHYSDFAVAKMILAAGENPSSAGVTKRMERYPRILVVEEENHVLQVIQKAYHERHHIEFAEHAHHVRLLIVPRENRGAIYLEPLPQKLPCQTLPSVRVGQVRERMVQHFLAHDDVRLRCVDDAAGQPILQPSDLDLEVGLRDRDHPPALDHRLHAVVIVDDHTRRHCFMQEIAVGARLIYAFRTRTDDAPLCQRHIRSQGVAEETEILRHHIPRTSPGNASRGRTAVL